MAASTHRKHHLQTTQKPSIFPQNTALLVSATSTGICAQGHCRLPCITRYLQWNIRRMLEQTFTSQIHL